MCGSPKIDAYVNLKDTNVNIPKCWLDKIGDRKVIILNSSIGNLLLHNKYFDVLEEILDKLSSNKDVFLFGDHTHC